VPVFGRKVFVLFTTWLLLLATQGNAQAYASTTFVIRVPEVLMLYLDGIPRQSLPIRVEDGRVLPPSVEVRVVANTSWVLWVQASALEGPLTLPPERVKIGDLRLSSLPKPLAQGRGPYHRRFPLEVELLPGEPEGIYHGVLTFNLARP